MSDPTGKALLQDIAENPDDDLPRLAYADWLEERGEAERAELIRLQVRRSRLPEGDSEAAKIRRREKAMLEAHGPAWGAPGPGFAHEWRRGFVEHVECVPQRLVEAGSELFDRFPIRSLSLRAEEADGPRVREIARQPWLSRVTHLRILRPTGVVSGLGDAALEALLASPNLRNLRALELLSGGFTARSARALGAASHLKLTELQINWNPIGWLGTRELAGAPHLAGLTRLDLANSTITADGAAAIASSPHLRNLRVLDLSRTGILAGGVRELTASSVLAHVEELSLNRCKLRVRAAQSLARCAHLKNLRELSLSSNRLEDEGASALADSPHLGGLRRLVLRANRITAAGARALAETEAWPGLRSLDLSRNALSTREKEDAKAWFRPVAVKV